MKEDQKEVLKAWIDGDHIQYYNKSLDHWFDCSEFKDCETFRFDNNDNYRIKPKNIVTTTRIERDTYNSLGLHSTYSGDTMPHNLKLTWSPDGKTLIKAEVI
jgi:ribonuclease BN (tRNA processing enzyme)